MTAGIVLAGGRSARFRGPGGASKLEAQLGGRSLLDRTVDAMTSAFPAIVIVGPSGGSRDDATYLADPAPFDGPLAGVRIGLAAVADPVVVVIGGDTPLARPSVLTRLADELLDPAADAAVLADGDGWRPLPVALRVATSAPAIDAAFDRGERSIRRALGSLRLQVVAERQWRALDPEGDTLFDIDTEIDLALAIRRLAPRA